MEIFIVTKNVFFVASQIFMRASLWRLYILRVHLCFENFFFQRVKRTKAFVYQICNVVFCLYNFFAQPLQQISLKKLRLNCKYSFFNNPKIQ